MRRTAALALVAAAAVTAAPAAAAGPTPQRLWHAFPLGRGRLVRTAPRTPAPRTPASPAPRARAAQPPPRSSRQGSLGKALAASATALTVVAVIAGGRRRGWAGRRTGAPGRRVGTEPRALALYAVAALVGVLVGVLIPLLS